jgi:hypothetical protein
MSWWAFGDKTWRPTTLRRPRMRWRWHFPTSISVAYVSNWFWNLFRLVYLLTIVGNETLFSSCSPQWCTERRPYPRTHGGERWRWRWAWPWRWWWRRRFVVFPLNWCLQGAVHILQMPIVVALRRYMEDWYDSAAYFVQRQQDPYIFCKWHGVAIW